MGCGPSALAVAELNKSLAAGEGGQMLADKLKDSPWLLSTSTSVLCSTVGTPLHTACERKQVQVVQEMLCFVAGSPVAKVREAMTPYCRRVGLPLPTTAEEGAKLAIDMINCKGQTPLMFACAAGSPELVKLLLAQGASPWLGDHCCGRNALHYAAVSGSAPCIEALLDHVRPQDLVRDGVRYIDSRTRYGVSALHYAVFFDHAAALEELLQHDPQINVATTGHSEDLPTACDALSTPLHFAARRGYYDLARQLLKHHLLNFSGGSTGRSHDPRMRTNSSRQLPWQVAAAFHPSKRDLLTLLHPAEPLERALGLPMGLTADGSIAVRAGRRGPLPLAALAAVALQAKLKADLRRLQTAAGGLHNAASSSSLSSEGSEEAERAAEERTTGGGSSGGVGSGVGGRAGGGVVGGSESDRSGRVAWTDEGASISSTHGSLSAYMPPRMPPAQRQRSAVTRGSEVVDARTSIGGAAPGSAASGAVRNSGRDGSGRVARPATVMTCLKQQHQQQQQQQQQQKPEEEDEEGMCGVCFAQRIEVAPAVCSHGLCSTCAAEMCRGMLTTAGRPRPLQCPFCRRAVAGFVAVAPALRSRVRAS